MNGTAQTQWVALLGRRNQPTDGVRDYCRYLGDALAFREVCLTMADVPWAERGWLRGLADLWENSGNWKGRWVLFQYTALAWSRRGFPFGALVVIAVLRVRAIRTAVVFHDWTGYTGPRLVDRIRWRWQLTVMRWIARLAHRNVLPVPTEKAAWLPRHETPAAFIPIGANLPTCRPEEIQNCSEGLAKSPGRQPTVCVFCITADRRGIAEVDVIASAAKNAAARLGSVRLIALGHGSEENRPFLERALEGTGVDLSVLGLVAAAEAAREISRADAALFVRGEIEGQRGSAIASIVCGTPLIGFGSPEGAFPLSDAGVVLVPRGDVTALGQALLRVLSEPALRQELREKNRRAQEKYFSWERIAQQFVEVLLEDRGEALSSPRPGWVP